MRRVLIREPGGYDRLLLVEEPTPTPQAGQVLVATEAIGVNYADCIVRMGLYSSAKKFAGWPITPGFEFSGRVAAVGAGVSGLSEGDAVIGVTLFGGYASHVLVPPHQLFAVPQGWTMPRAASFPTVHLTAWYGLCELCRPRKGYQVLVHSAAGGVGGAALGICRHLGMNAVGVVGSSHKVSAAIASGAVAVIDKSTQDLWSEARRLVPSGFDIVMEATGVETLRGSYRALRPTGRLVVFGLSTMLPKAGQGVRWWKLAVGYFKMPRFNPLHMIDKNKTVAAFNLSYLINEEERLGEAMGQLLEWGTAGALPEPTITTYALGDVAKAHAALESATTVGKLVLVP